MFLLIFFRLLASIAFEGACNLTFLLLSLIPSRKKTMRSKMKSIMCVSRSNALSIFALCALFGSLGLSNGCSSCESDRKPLWSDMEQTFDHLRGGSDAGEELSRDLAYLMDPEWDSLAETFRLLREKASPADELSSDIQILLAPEWGEFMDTLCRLAW
tara:strand:+ start:599 stop:1072 length:474 start_codon:yes stop_codon:yes gene_type:complete